MGREWTVAVSRGSWEAVAAGREGLFCKRSSVEPFEPAVLQGVNSTYSCSIRLQSVDGEQTRSWQEVNQRGNPRPPYPLSLQPNSRPAGAPALGARTTSQCTARPSRQPTTLTPNSRLSLLSSNSQQRSSNGAPAAELSCTCPNRAEPLPSFADKLPTAPLLSSKRLRWTTTCSCPSSLLPLHLLTTNPHSSFPTTESALEHYRTECASLTAQLADANADITDYTESSKELQEELEKELAMMEKGEREMRKGLEEARGDMEEWKVSASRGWCWAYASSWGGGQGERLQESSA